MPGFAMFPFGGQQIIQVLHDMSVIHRGGKNISAERGWRDDGIGAPLLEQFDVFLFLGAHDQPNGGV